jgi:hypothetical protein
MEKQRTSELTLYLELRQGKRLVAVLESIPRENDLACLLAILEEEVNRRRKELVRLTDDASGETHDVAFRERRAGYDRRMASDKREAIRLAATRYGS